MVNEQILDIEQGSWAAAANYLGYLIGAIWAIRIKLDQAHQWALVALLGTAITLGALYLTSLGVLIISIRLLAGVFSAVGIVATSMWVLGQRQELNATPIMYAGVGQGIAASAQLVAVMSERWLSPQIWLMLALVALAATALVIHGLFFEQSQDSPVSASIAATNSRLDAQALSVLYGLAGFGYIITATYLPLLITLAAASADIEFVWTAFGLSVIPSCFIWYQICRRLGMRMALVLKYADAGDRCDFARGFAIRDGLYVKRFTCRWWFYGYGDFGDAHGQAADRQNWQKPDRHCHSCI